jgi:hypothetical protein
MGIFSHIFTFGVGIYLGTYFSGQDRGDFSLIKINKKGLTVGTTNIIKISPKQIDIWDENFKIIIGNNKKND